MTSEMKHPMFHTAFALCKSNFSQIDANKEIDGPGSLGFPMGSTTGLGLGLAHSLLEGARQGGVYSKLSRTDLVELLGMLDSVIELELFYCNRLGLNTCPYLCPI
jgi:hypothetical protein